MNYGLFPPCVGCACVCVCLCVCARVCMACVRGVRAWGDRFGVFLLQFDVVLPAKAHVNFRVLLLAKENDRLQRQRLHELKVLLLRVARPIDTWNGSEIGRRSVLHRLSSTLRQPLLTSAKFSGGSSSTRAFSTGTLATLNSADLCGRSVSKLGGFMTPYTDLVTSLIEYTAM